MFSKKIVPQFYDPNFMPAKLDLAEFVELQEKDENVQKKIQEHLKASPLVKLLTSGTIPAPLTYAEAIAIDTEIENVQQAITDTRKRIRSLLNIIDGVGIGQTGSSNGEELAFEMDISKKKQLKTAIRSVFGVKTNTITYSMYKAAVEAKRTLEKTEANDYVNMKWKK